MIITLIYFLVIIYTIDNQYIKAALVIMCFVNISLDLYRTTPYFPIYPIESKSINDPSLSSIKVMSSNIYINNRQYKRLLDLANEEKPDVLLLLETDKEWQDGVESLKSDYPYTKLIPMDNTYGMLLYSKLEFESVRVEYLIDKKVPSIFAKLKVSESELVELVCIHPRPPRPKAGSSTQRDAELVSVAKYVKDKRDDAILVFGDLNDVAWSHTTRLFKRLSLMLDPRIGRGFYNTFPVKFPFARMPLDHFFHTSKLTVKDFRVLRDIGSDHLPMMASFSILKNNKKSGNPEHSDSQDEADEKQIKQEGHKWDGPAKAAHKDEE